jgi:serine/threonine protein phosphatase PrpC
MMRDPDIQQLMSVPAVEPLQTVEALIQAALAGGGRDNVSAIVAFAC